MKYPAIWDRGINKEFLFIFAPRVGGYEPGESLGLIRQAYQPTLKIPSCNAVSAGRSSTR